MSSIQKRIQDLFYWHLSSANQSRYLGEDSLCVENWLLNISLIILNFSSFYAFPRQVFWWVLNRVLENQMPMFLNRMEKKLPYMCFSVIWSRYMLLKELLMYFVAAACPSRVLWAHPGLAAEESFVMLMFMLWACIWCGNMMSEELEIFMQSSGVQTLMQN